MFQAGKDLMDVDVPMLQVRARAVRARVLRMAHAGKTPHVACALSCVDLLVALYFSVLRIDPERPGDENRDRLLLSKGHGCMAQYGALAERGFFPEEVLDEYARDGGRLAEHPGPHCVPGIEAATGSLGHGLAMGAGLALAAKLRGETYRAFVVLSDGECYEGGVWEAALFAPAQRLDGLIAIVDYNGWSAMGPTDAVKPLAEKWRAFGWAVKEIDGHDIGAMVPVLSAAPFEPGRPSAIIARTVKGKGVSFMEGDLEWHYRPPNDDDLRRALAEVGK
jgi:transketolase